MYKTLSLITLLALSLAGFAQDRDSRAELNLEIASEDDTPPAYQHGLALHYGPTISHNEYFAYMLVGHHYLFDLPAGWAGPLSDDLRLKSEIALGGADINGGRFIGSASMFVMYFPPFLQTERIQPYVEGGIGGIYTDFRIDGQGLRWNFTPQAGIGANLHVGDSAPWFLSARWHHISNASLDKENAGIDAIMVVLGRWF